ncbi:MAG: long-chain fatty acid--CoA ligase [Balneola sp.]
MSKRLLYINTADGTTLSWQNIRENLSEKNQYIPTMKYDSYKDVFVHIIQSLILDLPIVLLDTDLSVSEFKELQKNEKNEPFFIPEDFTYPETLKQLVDGIKHNKVWTISLFTSGTTGKPKKITHTFDSITKGVKVSEKYKDHIWGWAYNPTHMAGTQVFFQSLLNENTLVQLFGLSKNEILSTITKYSVSHLSATPTFLRLFIDSNKTLESLKSITCGGEKLNPVLLESLKKKAPNAKFRNVYASTEAGSLFSAEGEYFKVSEKNENKIKFQNEEILLHQSIVGKSNDLQIDGDWYRTGDMVEFSKENPNLFRFVSRKTDIINIGGYNVNPHEVEDVLNRHSGILISRVYSKKNSVLGRIIIADVVLKKEKINESEIRSYMRNHLQEYKIPRVIKFVEEIIKTRSGKTLRR